MSTFLNPTTTQFTTRVTKSPNPHRNHSPPSARASLPPEETENPTRRRIFLTSSVATSLALGLQAIGAAGARAENWGTHSFIKERFFMPELSPEDAAARIRQTAEGLHSIRDMLETMSWRYVLFYIRLKSAYLSKDMENALSTVPSRNKKSYVETANQLVDDMAEFDYYIRTPKVYESYVCYEKTLKSIDALVALLA